ncbi:MAG: glycosyltransferase [Bacteroidales bacterium]|nr:glycosyltransferase [Bacteroidales bacterium]
MAFANTYFKRFQAKDAVINELPQKDLFLSIVIPVFDEPNLCRSLQSLKDCLMPEKSIEVIVVINSSENSPKHIIDLNRKIYKKAKVFAEQNSNQKIKFHILNFEKLPKKFAGVGLARKIGMDEALHRFNKLEKSDGLIAGFDADALVEENYFTEIENYFKQNPKINAASIDFQHPVSGNDFSEDIYRNIIQYELHLRYFIEALRFANFPFAYHTIGSSFAVRADVYAKQGGMNRRKAGEDFYFLQKIIQLGNYGEINTTKVIPSPRISDRVPFGTGAAVKKMIENNETTYLTYSFELFEMIKQFFIEKNSFYLKYSLKKVPETISEFLKINKFEEDLKKIKKESPNINTFQKKFFEWFNAFRVIKFLNFAHEKYYKKQCVKNESIKLLKIYHPEIKVDNNNTKLLNIYRKIQIHKNEEL